MEGTSRRATVPAGNGAWQAGQEEKVTLRLVAGSAARDVASRQDGRTWRRVVKDLAGWPGDGRAGC